MARMYEQPNYYRARINPSNSMDDLKTVTWGEMYLVFGKMKNGSLMIHSILFPKKNFSLAQATIQAHSLERIFNP